MQVTLLGLLTIGAYGLVLYAFGAFVSPIHDDTGWTNRVVAAAFSVSALLGGFGALLTGRLLDRVGLRPVLVGSLVTGAGLLWLSAGSTSPFTFVALWGVGGGIINAGLFYNTTMAATARLVSAHHRARAFTWLTVLGGLAAPLAFPIAGAMIDAWGWRGAVRGMVVVLVICAVPAVVFVSGGSADDEATPAIGDAHVGFADVASALRSPDVRRWLIAVAASMMSLVAVQVHHVSAMEAAGIAAATTLAAIRGLLSLPGRAAASPFVTRFGTVPVLRGVYLLMALGTLSLAFAGPLVFVWLFVILTGLSFGAVAPLQGLYATDLYGTNRIGTMMGMQQVVMSLAAAAGPYLLGATVDATGNYALLLGVAVGLNVVAMFVFRRPGTTRVASAA